LNAIDDNSLTSEQRDAYEQLKETFEAGANNPDEQA
jgi:hypothetical protein